MLMITSEGVGIACEWLIKSSKQPSGNNIQ